jgi:hypothetical protein
MKALYAFFAGQFARVQEALEGIRLELIAEQQRHRELSAIKQWNLDLALDWNAEQQALSVSIGDLLQQIAGGALENIKKHYNRLGVRTSWEIWDQAVVEQAQKYGYDLIKQISDSTRKQIGETISQWIESPDDFQVLVEKIRRVIPGNPFFPRVRDRAQLIAATEVTRVYADARAAGMKAAGLRKMVWRTAEDELRCPYCRALGEANNGEGAEGTVEEGFIDPVTGEIVLRPPRHPGCRCWLVESPSELQQFLAQMPQPIESQPPPAGIG